MLLLLPRLFFSSSLRSSLATLLLPPPAFPVKAREIEKADEMMGAET